MQSGLLLNTSLRRAVFKRVALNRNPGRTIQQLERLANLLDSRYRIPLTKIQVGWDGILGIIPGVGDVLPVVFSLYIVIEAIRMRMPWSIILKMLGNILFDFIIGLIPLFGDYFDICWKANQRNVRLLRKHFERHHGYAQ